MDDNGQWWRDAVVYQIYPRSFADSDGDGIGDLRGISDRLDRLVDLGVDCIWLSPFYVSPGADAGYDVADYRDVDPMFGTLHDFDTLLAKAHRLGLRVIVDLVPNHTSTAHPWFQEALAAPPGSPERSRFHFRDGRGADGSEPPNNWPSAFFGPAWTRTTDPDGKPGQWYLHMFDSGQPDWNWDNEEVREEFRSILRFWLDRGVDGFRVDCATALVKAPGLPDVPENPDDYDFFAAVRGLDGQDLPPSPGGDQEGVHDIYRDWRSVLDEYGADRILTGEIWLPPRQISRYLRPDEMHQAFNFAYLEAGWSADRVHRVVRATLAAHDEAGAAATWVLSNHDVVRHATRFGFGPDAPRMFGIRATDPQPDTALGLRRARAATLSMLALPGSAYLYQGEELGLPEHTTLNDEARQDPAWRRSGGTQAGRDGCRIPLPWEADRPAAGFSPGGKTWLPQPSAYARLARDRQQETAGSTLEMYRQALGIRKARHLGHGKLDWLSEPADAVVALRNGDLLSVTNMGNVPVGLPPGDVVLRSEPGPDTVLEPDTTAWILSRPTA
ncbi:glycoside hydrolase family 13 protein [Amycolatopsis circi]|uniref:glycoside hydrolase family 13 protein n=1 Tax=Amycolatopsis circi TaxID=871959 RepID=UPI000E274058|nr:glycoside hydrolase family 13 protein [Amycolatopsis circi]